MNKELIKNQIEYTLQSAIVRKNLYLRLQQENRNNHLSNPYGNGLTDGKLNEVNEQIKDLENILKLF
jgi:hypothetical protein